MEDRKTNIVVILKQTRKGTQKQKKEKQNKWYSVKKKKIEKIYPHLKERKKRKITFNLLYMI